MNAKLEKVLNALWLLKYRNVVAYDVADGGISKFLVVGTAVSVNENKKLSSEFCEKIKFNEKLDGWHKGEWIIIDLDEIVIHLFASGHREKYNLDKLYKGKQIIISKNPKKKKDK